MKVDPLDNNCTTIYVYILHVSQWGVVCGGGGHRNIAHLGALQAKRLRTADLKKIGNVLPISLGLFFMSHF